MYRVMVVDDEAIVRESVARLIPWEKYRIELVRACASAYEALAYLKEHEVDLMLVDIRLPVMTGLELIEQVRREWPGIAFIMISGYADFEYARQAMRANALDYLLKPLNEVSLLSAVRKAQEGWEQKQFREHLREMGEKFTAYLIRQRMLLAMRLMLRSPDAQVQEIAEQTGFGDNPQYFSSVFHKFTEMTPSEFRKRMMQA